MFCFLEDKIFSGKNKYDYGNEVKKKDVQLTPFVRGCRPGDGVVHWIISLSNTFSVRHPNWLITLT